MNTLTTLLGTHDIADLQKAVIAAPKTTTKSGATVISDALGQVDCVRYTDKGIEFQSEGRAVSEPTDKDVILLTTSVSLCGTDIALIDKAHKGALPAEAIGKVVGHEAAGVIVGVGAAVTNWHIGQIVNLDSHFGCARPDHHSFEDCVASGKSCDGIAGGIRGALDADGTTRLQPIDGYWSRIITVPESALPVEIPLAVATSLAAPSTLESLGNIYMIIEQLDSIGVLAHASDTLCVVSGLGATGYPMAAVAAHYGCTVVGINPSAGKREFALKQGACSAVYAKTSEAASHVEGKRQIIVIVTAGDVGAYQDALAFLDGLDSVKMGLTKKVLIAFGLFEDPAAPMPGAPAELNKADGSPLPQRDFVFSRHHFGSALGTEVYGVCGRNLAAWKRLMKDLMPTADAAGMMAPPKLVAMLNEAQHQIKAADPLHQIADELNLGSAHVKELLAASGKLKLVANLLTGTN